MKNYAKMEPKREPKIDVWAIRGPTFEVLGGFLRSRIFDEFSIGKKINQKSDIWGLRGWKRRKPGQGRRVGRGPSEALESAEVRVKV